MINIRFKSIKTQLSIWFLIVALVPLLIVVGVIYRQRVDSIKGEVFSKLVAVRDLKVKQINTWLEDRSASLSNLAQSLRSTGFGVYFDENGAAAIPKEVKDNLRYSFNQYLESYQDWDEIFFVDAHSAEVILSSKPSAEGQLRSGYDYYEKVLTTREATIQDIYYSKTLNKPAMAFSLPVFSNGEQSKILGVLVGRIDLDRSLYSMLLDRTGIGDTGETLIVNNKTIALNELRWHENAPLRLEIKAKPAVMASQGNSGIVETGDYRNIQVLAAFAYIPKTKWGFVAKQDQSEVYAPITSLLRNVLLILLTSIGSVFLISSYVSLRIARPMEDLSRISFQMKKGDLSVRSTIDRQDEIGNLSQSFNSMAEVINSQMSVQQGNSELIEAIISARDMHEFAETVTQTLTALTNSGFAVFHLLDIDEGKFKPIYTFGGNEALNEDIDASSFEGEFGKILSSKTMSLLTEISENTRFFHKTILGDAVPTNIVGFPILIEKDVKAMVSLASFAPYTTVQLEIIRLGMATVGTGFSNILANDQSLKLADQLSLKNRELEAQTIELQRQSSALHDQNVELEVQQKRVEDANRLKSEFLSNMSHELRTPLNSIMALSRILTRRLKKSIPDEESSFLTIIERNGKQLLALINDILDLSKIEAGKVELLKEDFSINKLITELLVDLKVLAEEKNIYLEFESSFDEIYINSDKDKIRQILRNIVGNAVKFTQKGGVTVELLQNNGTCTISVVDTGIGISESDLSSIFDEFRQVDGSASRQFEGTGLGLAIAQKTVKILGGTISVSSDEGKGTQFRIELPHDSSVPVDSQKSYSEQRELEAVGEESDKSILVIDDDPNIVELIAEHIKKSGYQPLKANSGQEALKILLKTTPMAITLDLIMPEMDGWELLQYIRSFPKTRDVPVIIISMSEDRSTGFALGANAFITKPVDGKLLIEEIERLTGIGKKHVLIVDDNEIDRLSLTEALSENNTITTLEANNGKDLLEKLKSNHPDVIVLDLMMPEMDGFQALDKLRSDPKTAGIPVIVVTAKDLNEQEKVDIVPKVSSIFSKSNFSQKILLDEVTSMLDKIEKAKGGIYPIADSKLLLVEDNESAIIQITSILKEKGYDVDVAKGGKEALEYVEKTIPDGIILDLMMPEVDGFEVLENIRKSSKTADIPILILTAKDLTREDSERLSNMKFHQLVQKGNVDPGGLIKSIGEMLHSKSLYKTFEIFESTRPPTSQAPSLRSDSIADIKLDNNLPAGMKTILVIEDNPDNLVVIRALASDNYHLIEAMDGESGLKSAVASNPDLILLDISLPKMDGVDVLKELKANQKTASIPVIAVTAKAMKGDKENLMAAGFDEYLSKPIDTVLFTDTMNRYLT